VQPVTAVQVTVLQLGSGAGSKTTPLPTYPPAAAAAPAKSIGIMTPAYPLLPVGTLGA